MKKKEEALKKTQNKRNKRKKGEGSKKLLTPEQQAFLEREEKIDKINDKLNRPVIGITYIVAFFVIGLMAYILRFMITEKDEVIANAANSRLDSYAANVIRGDIVTADGKTVATNQGDERYYPYDNLFAHVAGYSEYTKAGIELVGNYYLLESHANIIERAVNTLREEKNEGDTVVSTLNYELQKTAYDALGSANGAVVVMEPDTGKILAMVSKPDFNPNSIDEVWQEANREGSTSSVLLNRATQGLYPPGSTFKILTTLAFMRQNPRQFEEYHFNCSREEQIFNSVTVHCFGRKIHGEEGLSDALANSCNQAYADIGTQLNVNKWRNMLETFLFNKSLPYTDASATSRFYLDGKSNSGYIPQTAFGQGDTLITPMHNAMIISAIANGGLMMKPYFIDSIENYKGTRIKKFSPSSYDTLLSADEVETLIGYLRKVVTDGTAADYFAGAPYEAAGKTGTAEYDNGAHDYSWFVGFNSVSSPGIAVSIVVEESDVNGVKATAVARKIMDAYYNLESIQ
ncbi:MAG: penicillin-binding transpeptidase domain-containing protein [Bacteroidales bacterium]|nr:penicillin-binding transpeptidase domain-containing protein [Clostridium sp.]MCM1203087.1 penicillin-binding transpeptidase domain-containing protein [Bacteroidales bacterium]